MVKSMCFDYITNIVAGASFDGENFDIVFGDVAINFPGICTNNGKMIDRTKTEIKSFAKKVKKFANLFPEDINDPSFYSTKEDRVLIDYYEIGAMSVGIKKINHSDENPYLEFSFWKTEDAPMKTTIQIWWPTKGKIKEFAKCIKSITKDDETE